MKGAQQGVDYLAASEELSQGAGPSFLFMHHNPIKSSAATCSPNFGFHSTE